MQATVEHAGGSKVGPGLVASRHLNLVPLHPYQLDTYPGRWDRHYWLSPMSGLTMPYRGVRLHLTLSPANGLRCESSGGHKALGASEIQGILATLGFASSDLAVMGELRALVAQCGYLPIGMADGEVIERIGCLLSAGYLQALECGTKPLVAKPPSIAFGQHQLHLGSPQADFAACASSHTHEPLKGERAAVRLEQMLRSTPAGMAAVVEAAVQATGSTAFRGMAIPALIGSLTALAASGKLMLSVCRPGAGGGGGGPSGQAAGQGQQGAAGGGPSQSPTKGASPSSSSATATQLTWVCVELVDEDGNALEGEDYEITLSDGSVRKGKTTKNPFYADQIPEGVCSMKFPNLHKNYWRPPGSK